LDYALPCIVNHSDCDHRRGYMSPDNPDFDPGLPQRYEDDIARIKELVAEDEENASEPAPQPDSSTHEEGHSLDADGASGSGTISGTVADAPQNIDPVPFVVDNPDELERRTAAGQVQYLDANDIAQCARLPLAWQNAQEGWIVSHLERTNRLTALRVMGDELTYGSDLAKGTLSGGGHNKTQFYRTIPAICSARLQA